MQKQTFRKFRAVFIAIVVTAMTNYAISFATTSDLATDDETIQVDTRGQDTSSPVPPKPKHSDRGQDTSSPKPPKPPK